MAMKPENNKTYIMYYCTTFETALSIEINGFHRSKCGLLGRGVYLTRDLDNVRRYLLDFPDWLKAVIKVQVNVGKVRKIDCKYHPIQTIWHELGYDTAWVPPNCEMLERGLEENCVWDPRRIHVRQVIRPTPVQYHNYFGWEEDQLLPQGIMRLEAPEAESNRTFIMYHGTALENALSICMSGFRQSQDGVLGRGVYLSRDLEKACRYPRDVPDRDKVVLKVQVNVGKVKKIERLKHPHQKTWYNLGYDTAWVPPNCGMVYYGLEENCVWDPRRIQILQLIKPFDWLEDSKDGTEEDADEDQKKTPRSSQGQNQIQPTSSSPRPMWGGLCCCGGYKDVTFSRFSGILNIFYSN